VLEPEGIGNVSFVEGICRYAILIAALGIPIYGVREASKYKKDKIKLGKLCGELLIIHFISTLLIGFVYLILIFNSSKLYSHLLYYLLGIVMISSNVLTLDWFFQGTEDFKFVTVRTILIRIVSTIIIFLVVRKVDDGLYFFGITVLTSFVNGIINYWHLKRSVKLDYSLSKSDLKKHLAPLFFIFSSTLSISIYVILDTIMLGFMSNSKAVGFYAIALKISKVPIIFISAIGTVLIPRLSHTSFNKDYQAFDKLIEKSLNFVFTISFPMIFFTIGFADKILVIFAGHTFVGASATLKLLSVVVLLIGLSNIFGLQILIPLGKDKFLAYSVFLGTIVSLLMNFILIPRYHDRGAAITNVITEIVVTALTLFYASKFVKLSFDYSFIFKSLIFSIPIYLLSKGILLFINNDILALSIGIIISFLYFILIQFYVIRNSLIIQTFNNIIKKNA
jgi:O-antigen/teichoic acid export membrane protein